MMKSRGRFSICWFKHQIGEFTTTHPATRYVYTSLTSFVTKRSIKLGVFVTHL